MNLLGRLVQQLTVAAPFWIVAVLYALAVGVVTGVGIYLLAGS